MPETDTLVDMRVGDWALCFSDSYFRSWESTRENLELFRLEWAGWDYERKDLFQFNYIEKVMPKTYLFRKHYSMGKEWVHQNSRRGDRGNVIFTALDPQTLLEKSSTLVSIGLDAANAIEAERLRLMSKFEKEVRSDAVKKIHNLFPNIFKD